MRIGIDARLYGEEENRGLGRYVKELVLNLEKIARDDEFFVFLTKKNFNAYQPSAPNFKKILWDVHWYTLKEQIPLFSPFAKGGLRRILDLVHFPHWNVPYFYNRPFIVTIHDLILFESNRSRQATTLGQTRYALKFAGFKMILNHALKKAAKIIAISQTTKNELTRRFAFTSNKTQVVYQGMSKLTAPPPHPNPLPRGERGISKPYLLYVGSAYPHKNLEFLIQAFNEFNANEGEKYQLALVGHEDFFYQRLKEKTKSPQIIFWGKANDEELGALYQNAAFFISASLTEGFGLPPLEAFSLGTPAILSDIECFQEIMPGAAIFFDPRDKESLKKTLKNALNNPEIKTELLKSGRILQDRYSWPNCAKQTLALYHNAICSQKTK
ncbi:MAG: glycosyltransferase family 1 protein [bacterium]|nr:glycosyltransferase family 1 protein [bacterium]